MIALLEVYYPNIPPILALSDLTFMYGVRDVTVTILHVWTSFASMLGSFYSCPRFQDLKENPTPCSHLEEILLHRLQSVQLRNVNPSLIS